MLLNKVIYFEEPLKGISVESFIPFSEYKSDIEKARGSVKEQLDNERKSLSEGLFKALQDQTEAMNKRLPDIVMSIVRRVLGEVELDKNAVLKIVNGVLMNDAPDGENLELFLSDADYKLIESDIAGVKKTYPRVKFQVDQSLKSGDCLVRSKFGLIDATVDTKIKQVEREFGT